MKAKTPSRLLSIATASVMGFAPAILHAAALTWDGGGGDGNWSTNANWVGDPATDPASGDTLTFAGSTQLVSSNDITGLVLGSAGSSISFSSGAGAFEISGQSLTLGSSGGGGYTVITQASSNNQTISANLALGSGGGDRSVVMSGSGNLTLSGNLNFSNSWLFPATSAGTIVLSGNNSGDGKGSVVSSGTNQMRATIGNNVAGTQLVLGSDTALGNATTGDVGLGTAAFRGIQARQQTNISTAGNRDLSAYAISINANNVTFNGGSNMTIGHIINQGGNRDFVVSSTGRVTVSNGISLSNDQTGRTLYLNLSGTGGMVVDGRLYDTFHSGGLTSGTALLRKAGTSTLVLNGDSSSFGGGIQVDAGTLKIGHAGALGNTTGTTTIASGATLDLNGQSIGESISSISGSGVGANGALINSNTSITASITQDIVNPGNLTIGGAGDITLTRIRSAGVFTVTKLGDGTLTTNGSGHNNLSAWDIRAGRVVFANTSDFAADRGVILNGGILQLSGGNSNLINDVQSFTINSGTFDLNGKTEAVASIGGSGGMVTNTAASGATLRVGGGVSGESTASYSGVIRDGAGVLSLVKEGGGTQTLTGANTYTGLTRIDNGTLSLGGSGSITNSSGIRLHSAASRFNITTATGGFTLGSSQTLSGVGTVEAAGRTVTIAGTLAPGNSPGALTVDGGTLVLAVGGEYDFQVYDALGPAGTGYDTVSLVNGATLDLTALSAGSYTIHLLGLSGIGPDVSGDAINFDNTRNYSWTLFATASSLLAGFDVADFVINAAGFTNDLGGGAFSLGLADSDTDLVLNFTPVPEPRAALLGGLGLLVMLRRRR